MKFLQIRDLQNAASALNFNTVDTRVAGSCELYTTKAAGPDKKLYKDIENSLESQHRSLLRLSASLSPPVSETVNLDLARSSPFGPLSQVSSRRTFAYLVATLNAAHPDYDFSDILRPADFRRERSLKEVMATVDQAIYNLRPRPAAALLAAPTHGKSAKQAEAVSSLGNSHTWGPKMWRAIDKEMSLTGCAIYRYTPETDPFNDEQTALWSHHFFFCHKERKRVCYVYIRGYSMMSRSPTLSAKRNRTAGVPMRDVGASKRAKFWLGERAGQVEDDDQDDYDHVVGSSDAFRHPGDDEVDADETLEGSDVSMHGYSGGSDDDDYFEVGDDDVAERSLLKQKGPVRRMSEHIAETMDL